jgi:hypothetical protein
MSLSVRQGDIIRREIDMQAEREMAGAENLSRIITFITLFEGHEGYESPTCS